MHVELHDLANTELSLDDLVNVVAELLGRSEFQVADGRVAGIPDVRTLRYYQTIGVLDKPLRYEGRKAVYGYRHFLQAVGIKLMQAQGYSLTQIERVVPEAATAALEQRVVDALGATQAISETPPHLPVVSVGRDSGTLIAAEVGQGVSVILDPRQVEDPEVILAAMRELLSALQEGI